MDAIVFDLDETLIDRYQAMTCFAEDLWSEFFSDDCEVSASFVDKIHQLDGYGYVPRDVFYEAVLEEFSENIQSKSKVREKFREQVWETPRLAKGVPEVLSQLKKKGVHLAIVSNGSTEAQYAKIDKSGISHFFEAVIISEAAGVKKPEPEIYLKASDQLGVNPKESWFVGDHPINDIWGSRQVGFNTAWVHLKRPWAAEVDECFDLKGLTFMETMNQLMDKL